MLTTAYRLVRGIDDGDFRRFLYHIDDDHFLRADATGDGFEAALVPYRQVRVEQVVEAGIDAENNSLVAALGAQDQGVLLAVALAEVLGGEIDFNNDLRRGRRVRDAVRGGPPRGTLRGRRRAVVLTLRRRARGGVHQRRSPAAGVSLPRAGRARGAVFRPPTAAR